MYYDLLVYCPNLTKTHLYKLYKLQKLEQRLRSHTLLKGEMTKC